MFGRAVSVPAEFTPIGVMPVVTGKAGNGGLSIVFGEATLLGLGAGWYEQVPALAIPARPRAAPPRMPAETMGSAMQRAMRRGVVISNSPV